MHSYSISSRLLSTVSFSKFYLPPSLSARECERERTMVSSSFSPLSQFSLTSFNVCEKPTNHKINKIPIGCTLKLTSSSGSSWSSSSSTSLPSCQVLHKSLPLAAAVVLLWSNPGNQIHHLAFIGSISCHFRIYISYSITLFLYYVCTKNLKLDSMY